MIRYILFCILHTTLASKQGESFVSWNLVENFVIFDRKSAELVRRKSKTFTSLNPDLLLLYSVENDNVFFENVISLMFPRHLPNFP